MSAIPETLPEHARKLLEQLIKDKDISNAVITTNCGSEKGDNYLGEMTTIDITGNSKSSEINLHIMLKKAPQSDALRKSFPIRKVYLREIAIYEEIYPMFKNFQQKIGCKNKIEALAESYGSCSEELKECLLLENLSFKGYKMWNRLVNMDENHVLLVLDQYAHLHACSLAIKSKNVALFEEIQRKTTDHFGPDLVKHVVASTKKDMEYLVEYYKQQPVMKQYLEKMTEKMYDSLMMVNKKSDTAVVCHGDNWCNNILFKYDNIEEPSVPSHVVFVDWQISKLSPLFADICTFFYLHASPNMMRNVQKYQLYYYNKLKFYMNDMKTILEDVFTFEKFCELWKSFNDYSFAMHCLMYRVLISVKNEAKDIAATVEDGKNYMDNFNEKGSNEHLFLERTKVVAEHFINYK